MPELNTLGSVIKSTYEAEPDTNAFTDAEKVKLAGIENEATKNASDADLLDRSNHTGIQPASTISDLPDILEGKKDAVPGKDLSDENFTSALKQKLEGLEDPNFKGVFLGLAALQAAYPNGEPGQYASVDDGSVVQWYAWNEGVGWEPRLGESAELTPAQVKSYYESNADTNAFTDDYKAQLDDLELRGTWRRLGVWNAATNTPTLINGTGRNFDYYVVTTAGDRSFGSFTYPFQQYDWVVYQGGTWTRLPLRDAIRAINGKAPTNGEVNLTSADIGAQPKMRGAIGPAIPAGMWRKTEAQSVPHNTYTTVAWNSSIYDQFGIWDGTGIFIIPSWAKYARVTSMIYYASNTTGFRQLGITLNGAFVPGVGNDGATVPSVDLAERGLSKSFTTPVFPVSAGQSLRIQTAQTSGVSLDILAPDPTLRRDSSVYIELFE